MSATVYLDTPLDGEAELECDQVRVAGGLVRARPVGGDRERVVPLSNVTGIAGDDVAQEIEEVEYRGGHVTELVTEIQ